MTEQPKGPPRLGQGPLDTITLLNIEGILNKTLELVLEQRADGIVEPLGRRLTITDHGRLVKNLTPGRPWFSVQVINSGPNSVFVIVNSEKNTEWHEVTMRETYRIDFGRAAITDLLLKCNTGETAVIRLVGVR